MYNHREIFIFFTSKFELNIFFFVKKISLNDELSAQDTKKLFLIFWKIFTINNISYYAQVIYELNLFPFIQALCVIRCAYTDYTWIAKRIGKVFRLFHSLYGR